MQIKWNQMQDQKTTPKTRFTSSVFLLMMLQKYFKGDNFKKVFEEHKMGETLNGSSMFIYIDISTNVWLTCGCKTRVVYKR